MAIPNDINNNEIIRGFVDLSVCSVCVPNTSFWGIGVSVEFITSVGVAVGVGVGVFAGVGILVGVGVAVCIGVGVGVLVGVGEGVGVRVGVGVGVGVDVGAGLTATETDEESYVVDVSIFLKRTTRILVPMVAESDGLP